MGYFFVRDKPELPEDLTQDTICQLMSNAASSTILRAYWAVSLPSLNKRNILLCYSRLRQTRASKSFECHWPLFAHWSVVPLHVTTLMILRQTEILDWSLHEVVYLNPRNTLYWPGIGDIHYRLRYNQWNTCTSYFGNCDMSAIDTYEILPILIALLEYLFSPISSEWPQINLSRR